MSTIVERVEALLKRDESWIEDNLHALVTNLENAVAHPAVEPTEEAAEEPNPTEKEPDPSDVLTAKANEAHK